MARLMIALLLLGAIAASAGTPWGADYFPNVPLITHEGKTVHFFDDMIEGKVVAINFIYTSCPDSCPLETARMAKVQKLLGDRVGKDIFMYSITIDPEVDTPEVLARYAKRYQIGPGWVFLTGKDEDITLLRRKLGLYVEEIQDGSNNHNLNLIIGNQATGQWVKRSPFENPYILAKEMGSYLTGWKDSPQEMLDYAAAPEVRGISQGEHLFRTRCTTCHTVGNGQEDLAPGLEGPDLLGVTERRDREWLIRWIMEPDKMLEEGDPIALGLYAKYDEVPMPNMRLSPADVVDILAYLSSESRSVQMERARQRRRQRVTLAAMHKVEDDDDDDDERLEASHAVHATHEHAADSRPIAPASTTPASTTPASTAPGGERPQGDTLAIMNAWVREALPEVTVQAGYMTLVNVGSNDETLVAIESPAFDKVEIHEMAPVDGLMKMHRLAQLVVPAGGQAQLAPGGAHLMLMGPHGTLGKGQHVDLKLTFDSGKTQTVSLQVEDR